MVPHSASCIGRCLVVLVVATLSSVVVGDDEELLRGKEHCLRHDDFPSPSECCAKPHWMNQYSVRRCQYVHWEVDGGRYERGSCAARCGLYKINMTMTDRIQRVRIFRPRLRVRAADEAWAHVLLDALRTCKPRITAMQGRHVAREDEMEQCEIAEDIFGDCVDAQMFMHCPHATWIGSESCNMMRELLESGCPYKTVGDVVVLDDEGRVRDSDRTYDDGYDRLSRRDRTGSPRYDPQDEADDY